MAESALENVKRTLERRRDYIKKGRTVEGARGYQYSKLSVQEEINELAKIKNMDNKVSTRILNSGNVNIRCKGSNLADSVVDTNGDNQRKNETEDLVCVSSNNKRTSEVFIKNSSKDIEYFADTLVYQSAKKVGVDENGIIADDMKFNDYDDSMLTKINILFWSDLILSEKLLFNYFISMCKTLFSKGEMEDVVEDMIKHFRGGSGSDYTNPILTKHVKKHDNTNNYIEEVKKYIIEELKRNDGNLKKIRI